MKITTPAKATKDCFKGFYYRDPNIDGWLPKEQPAREGEISIHVLKERMTFLEMAQKFFGSTDIEVIKKYALTLPMVEEMIENHSKELDDSGYGNFFFVENEDGGVSVAGVSRDDGDRHWLAFVLELADGYRWDAGLRLLVCNLDTRATLSLERAIEMVKEGGYQVSKIL